MQTLGKIIDFLFWWEWMYVFRLWLPGILDQPEIDFGMYLRILFWRYQGSLLRSRASFWRSRGVILEVWGVIFRSSEGHFWGFGAYVYQVRVRRWFWGSKVLRKTRYFERFWACLGCIFDSFFDLIFDMFSKRFLDIIFLDLGSHKDPKRVPEWDPNRS